MKKLKVLIAVLPGTLAAFFARLTRPRNSIALANANAFAGMPLAGEGDETLTIDPSVTLPVTSKWLIYERGASYNTAEIALGTKVPLGPSPDAPDLANDLLLIHRLGVKKGMTFGVPKSSITQDKLLIVDPAGTGGVVDVSTVTANGTYWVVGRAVANAAGTEEYIAYAPDVPYEINNASGTWTFVGANT